MEINDKKNNKENIRDKSRFNFCEKNDTTNDYVKVPKHILDLINKKINLYNLTKFVQQKNIDKIFLNDSIYNENINENDEWTKFINDNIDINNYNKKNNNDEVINDINHINKFILNKVSPQIRNDDNNK